MGGSCHAGCQVMKNKAWYSTMANSQVSPYSGNWSLASPTYLRSASIDPSNGLSLSNDGTVIFAWGGNFVYRRTMGTPYDISTLSSATTIAATSSAAGGLAITGDGTRLYGGNWLTDRIYQINMPTPYSFSGASEDASSLDVFSQYSNSDGVMVNPDGSILYGVEKSGSIYQYTMSSPKVISTASYSGISLNVTARNTNLRAACIDPSTGKRMFLLDGTNFRVDQYTLSSAWDISTATYDSVSYSYPNPSGLEATEMCVSNNGKYMYLHRSSTIYQYQLY